MMRFIKNCRSSQDKLTGPLNASEIHNSSKLWIKCCQELAFPDEICAIQQKRTNSSKVSRLRQLGLYLDEDNLIRCQGRIHNASLSDSSKFPYLLPNNHFLSTLIVKDSHERILHSGVNMTITHIRQLFWIPRIRQLVRKILGRCVTCRKVMGKPYTAPNPPPLPKIRLQEAPPFTATGIDFTGALHIKDKTGTLSKAYICLFTCAATRAIHLEVMTSLSEHSFLQALRRFTGRKSVPKVIVTDNAATFIASSEELKRLFDSHKVQNILSSQGIEWRFNPKRAPWFGGWWERLVGLTKTSLKKILGRSLIDLETLQTVITEIESILNNRPLTYVSTDYGESEPLTPAHLLYGRMITPLPYPNSDNVT